mmetsp:Transcript_41902/g.64128  ORF Transcript_41902/g.64128 Transcript_41902/m.64128 type:complete len:204 (+) Transcript_41902:41-652(+)
MDAENREDSIYFARLSEQGERYEDMIKYMKKVAKFGQELSNDERNLLSVAYKNSVKTRRDAWRTIQAIRNKEELKQTKYLPLITHYKEKIEKELRDICNDVLDLLESDLLKNSENPEAKVFFLKMKGDYYRYLGEFMENDEKKKVIDKAQDSYQQAQNEAEKLKTTHPIRLGLALNYSVFYYEILNQPDVACKLAKNAFDAAI